MIKGKKRYSTITFPPLLEVWLGSDLSNSNKILCFCDFYMGILQIKAVNIAGFRGMRAQEKISFVMGLIEGYVRKRSLERSFK